MAGSFFCLYCGLKAEGNVNNYLPKGNMSELDCPYCLMRFNIQVWQAPKRKIGIARQIFKEIRLKKKSPSKKEGTKV